MTLTDFFVNKCAVLSPVIKSGEEVDFYKYNSGFPHTQTVLGQATQVYQ